MYILLNIIFPISFFVNHLPLDAYQQYKPSFTDSANTPSYNTFAHTPIHLNCPLHLNIILFCILVMMESLFGLPAELRVAVNEIAIMLAVPCDC